ncbi:MAG: hypothetical protein LBE50_03825 [Gallionellaceae bacterium]|nr:hypothetical protein [Gallionellaceae bacterium]
MNKRKPMAPRNPFVAAAKFKKAGAHKKPYKAIRRAEKQALLGRSSKVEQEVHPRGDGSIPSAPTRKNQENHRTRALKSVLMPLLSISQ